MKKIRMISLLLALLTASSLMSCGSEGKAPESTDAGTTKTDEETTSEYTYPDDYPELNAEITVTGAFEIYEKNGIKYCRLANAAIES